MVLLAHMIISQITKSDKKNVIRFYKREGYSARFIGHDTGFIFNNEQQQIVASVIVSSIEQENLLHALVTQKEQQRHGIASELITHCKSKFDQLVCFADLGLASLYCSHGFVIGTENQLNSQLLKRWQSYQKKNPKLTIFRYEKNDE